MKQSPSPTQAGGCDGRCDGCQLARTSGPADGRGPLRGRAMAVSAVVYFLLPLATAAAGAWLGGADRPHRQLLAGLGGLAGGMVLAGLYARLVNRRTGVVS